MPPDRAVLIWSEPGSGVGIGVGVGRGLTLPPLAFLIGGRGFGLGAPAPNSLPGGITGLSGSIGRGIKSSEGDGGGGLGGVGFLAISTSHPSSF